MPDERLNLRQGARLLLNTFSTPQNFVLGYTRAVPQGTKNFYVQR